MNRICLVFVFEIERNIFVCSLYSIDKLALALNHSLIYQFFVGFVRAYNANVKQELADKSRVEQVSCCMFAASDIQIDILPIGIGFFGHKFQVIVRVHVANGIGI